MDLLDTDVFFSTEQLGVSELDMAGLTDVDLAHLDNKIPDDHQIDAAADWSNSVDLDLQPSDLVQFGDPESEQPSMTESDTSNQGGLDDDFQKMLSDWESHIGSLSSSCSSSSSSCSPDNESMLDSNTDLSQILLSSSSTSVQSPASIRMSQVQSSTRQLPVSVRTPVLPKPGVTYTRVAGIGPRVAATRISHIHSPSSPPPLPVRSAKVSLASSSKDWFISSNSSCPTAALPDNVKFSTCTVNDLSRTLENQKKRMQWLETNFNRNVTNQVRARQQQAGSNSHSSVKIIAAVSPGKNGQSTTRILSTRHDSLPRELIEKIKAASQGRKTIAIIEPINKKPVTTPAPVEPPRNIVRARSWISPNSQTKWRHVGIVNPIQTQNMSDHDYCSPTKTVVEPFKYGKIIRASSQSIKTEASNSSKGRDSGLESDGSDNSEDGGLYDKLPSYLTSVSVQTGVDEDGEPHYSRVPYYMTTTTPTQNNNRQSLLKYSTQQGFTVKQENVILQRNIDEDNNVDETGDTEYVEMERIQRKRSLSPGDFKNVINSKYRRSNSRHRNKVWRNVDEDKRDDRQKNSGEERKIVYVGKIEEGTLKADLRSRFETFGPIVDVSIHFRERGDNYGFITFENKEDAYQAVEHGNDDPNMPTYDLCFGGRRAFCKEKYFDMDYVDEKKTDGEIDFDQLLEAARVSSS